MCNVTFRRVLETIVAVESDKHDFCSCVRARVGEGMRMRACVRPRVCVCVWMSGCTNASVFLRSCRLTY